MVNIKVMEQEYQLDIAVLPKTLVSILEGNSLPLILSAEEIADVIKKRTKASVKPKRTRSFNRSLLMLHKMYITGFSPRGYVCDTTKVLNSIRKILENPDNQLEDLSNVGREIALKYLVDLDLV